MLCSNNVNTMTVMSRKVVFFHVIWALLSCLYCLSARAEFVSPLLSRLSTEEGLSQNSVKTILQDRDGFIWLATKGGLDRFDGYNVKHIEGPNGVFADVYIQHIFQDSTGLLWVGTRYSGLFAYDLEKNEARPYFFDLEKLERRSVSRVADIIEDKDKNLWVASKREVKFFDRTAQEMRQVFSTREIGESPPSIRQLLLQDSILYIATTSGLFALDIQSKKWRLLEQLASVSAGKKQPNVKELYLTPKETLWVGTVKGLYSLSTKHARAFVNGNATDLAATLRLEHRNIWRILAYKDAFHLATDDGLLEFSPETNESKRLWRFSDTEFDLFDNNIRNMLRDEHGNYWLASKSNGIYIWQPNTANFKNLFPQKGKSNQLSHRLINTIIEGAQSTVWIGTKNGLNRHDIPSGRTESFMVSTDKKSSRTSGTIYQIVKRGNGTFWLATGTGLVNFDPVAQQRVPLHASSEDDRRRLNIRSWDYAQDELGRLWYKTKHSYYLYDPELGSVEPITSLNEQFPPELASSFLGPGPYGKGILFGVDSQLWQIDIHTKQGKLIYQLPSDQQRERVEPDSWVIDRNNVLWVTFSGFGLVGIDAESHKTIYKYDVSNKLPTTSIFSLLLDNDGDIWFGSYGGVMRMDVDSHHIEHFTMVDGLKTNEFREGANYRLSNGDLIFGSVNGITRFSPTRVKQRLEPEPKVRIGELSLLSRSLAMPVTALNDSKINLAHDDIGIKLVYSTLSYSNQKQTRYRYWLEGSRTVNYPETTENSITFPQLMAGEYVFNIQSFSRETGKQGPVAKISIDVQHAPWASPVAYSIYILLLSGAWFVWYRVKRRQKQNLLESKERLQLALAGSGSEVWDWHAPEDLIYQRRSVHLASHKYLASPHSMSDHIDFIFKGDRERFTAAWTHFINGHISRFECDYRIASSDGALQWYRDLGKVVAWDEHGKPVRVTGTYTNITTTRANEEKARIFGEAFRKILDWVLILNTQFKPIAINNALCNALELSESDLLKGGYKLLNISVERQHFYRTLLTSLVPGQHWQGEEIVSIKGGTERPVLVNISAVNNGGVETEFFVIVLTDISKQKMAENELRYLANYDDLTGLPNRSLALDRVKHAIEHAHRYQSRIALFFLDLDKFKQVNDSLGHDFGDQLLQNVTKRLTKALNEDDTLARLSGDEFIIMQESFESVDELAHVAQNVIDAVSEPISLKGHRVSVSSSVGIALYPDDALCPSDLIKHADIAMYHAKEQGRGSFQFFTKAMNEKAVTRLKRENDINQGHENNEFCNHYQPIVDGRSGKVIGLELLLRWQSNGKMIPPCEFIPIAEETGLIIPMTHAAISRGLRDLRYWRYELGYDVYLSINLSALHLEREDLAEQVKIGRAHV